MDAEKSKKLQQYAAVLNEQAMEEERTGKSEEAIKHYLKLVDVFLVLAAEAQDHNTWLQYIHQAEAYQNRTRSLIPKDQQNSALANQVASRQREVSNTIQKADTTQNKLSPLKKMLKPFQRSEEEISEIGSKTFQAPKTPIQSGMASPQLTKVPTSVATDNTIPSEVYQRVLSENKILRDKVTALTKEKDERIAALEQENRELEQKISEMVPRADYDALQSEIGNLVPKTEYERIRAELLNSVPKEHYDDLLNRIAAMVPKQAYLDAERRVMELENAVKNSVPNKIIEDLASEVSLLGVLSEVPLEHAAISKEAEKTENQVATEIVQSE